MSSYTADAIRQSETAQRVRPQLQNQVHPRFVKHAGRAVEHHPGSHWLPPTVKWQRGCCCQCSCPTNQACQTSVRVCVCLVGGRCVRGRKQQQGCQFSTVLKALVSVTTPSSLHDKFCSTSNLHQTVVGRCTAGGSRRSCAWATPVRGDVVPEQNRAETYMVGVSAQVQHCTVELP